MIDYRYIEAFLAVVNTNSLSKAAESLYVSQSSISKWICQLEEEIGVELIVRHKGQRSIELTASGKELVPLAEEWMNLHGQIIGMKEHNRTSIRIVSVDSLNNTLMPPIYQELLRTDPELELSVLTGQSPDIYSMVERDCETEIFPVCLEKGIGVVPFSPIASGFLSGKVTAQEQFGFDDVRKFVPQLSKENIEANRPILDLLHRFAVEKNATNAQISLAWMLHKYPNVVPIPGSKNQERILENLGAWNVTLSGDEFRQLQSALDECKVHGHRGCVETEQTSFGKQWSEETAK